jgi:hypothetical protein
LPELLKRPPELGAKRLDDPEVFWVNRLPLPDLNRSEALELELFKKVDLSLED